ncbi:unnamed protein product [Pieris macdunnoughi]|uniref:Uncharacterized protein n=1 Tax=Pieris macdunnoughi TaxID=345717 RepID=A0A821SI60_9NEOP|nr:unnamed protein product [Pieris macdunnoughi]
MWNLCREAVSHSPAKLGYRVGIGAAVGGATPLSRISLVGFDTLGCVSPLRATSAPLCFIVPMASRRSCV